MLEESSLAAAAVAESKLPVNAERGVFGDAGGVVSDDADEVLNGVSLWTPSGVLCSMDTKVLTFKSCWRTDRL